MTLSSRQRMLKALCGQKPDRLPVTTHHVQPYFLNKYMKGMTNEQFFEHFGFDQIVWTNSLLVGSNEYTVEYKSSMGFTFVFICNDQWRIETENITSQEYPTTRFNIITPSGRLSMTLQFNECTFWVAEHLIKSKENIDLLQYMTIPKCDIDNINITAEQLGDRGIVRGTVCGFDIFGQPGTWQDAACLVGIQKLIMETYDDPSWVHQLLNVLQQRKQSFIDSLKDAKYDILELGGGDASSTVISPGLFEQFVAPYDNRLIEHAHSAGQKIVYHTCGGMMPILGKIAAMKPDAMETFTPPEMGGDTDLAEARKCVPSDICMIGGFDQFHFFTECSEQQTRVEVRRCFEAAGRDGGFIISPSDHFFDADPKLITAFVDEARKCLY